MFFIPKTGASVCVCNGGEHDLAHKIKNPRSQRGLSDLFCRGKGLPLTDNSLALTEDHVVNIDTGESGRHTRYHFLSILS